jgi:hypothetical protein
MWQIVRAPFKGAMTTYQPSIEQMAISQFVIHWHVSG